MYHFNVGSFQQVYAFGEAIFVGINHALDASLNDELGTFYAWRVGDVERGAIAVVAASGQLGYGVGFGVKDIRLCDVVLVFTHVLKAARRAVLAIADNHLVLDHQCAHLTAFAVAVLCPYTGHTQVALVEEFLLLRAVALGCGCLHIVVCLLLL